MISEAQIRQALEQCIVPYLNLDVIAAKALRSIVIDGAQVNLSFRFNFPVEGWLAQWVQDVRVQLQQQFPDIANFSFEVSSKIRSHAVQAGVQGCSAVKNVVAIASGKGGVGKSTTTVNLALALMQAGARVGILDADIYGPNQPHMLGATDKPEMDDNKKFTPVMAHGLQTNSIGYLIDVEKPMVWRGPMVSGALKQLFNDTQWQDLDYLLVDLPPGTGDVQLTLAKSIPVSGAVIVTTPQDIALLDARKGLEMFRKVDVPVLGVIENMSMHECSQCGHQEPLFGERGAQTLADACDVPMLGKLPLLMSIRQAVDAGKPSVVADPDSAIAKQYRDIALTMVAKLSMQAINYAVKFPAIVVES